MTKGNQIKITQFCILLLRFDYKIASFLQSHDCNATLYFVVVVVLVENEAFNYNMINKQINNIFLYYYG